MYPFSPSSAVQGLGGPSVGCPGEVGRNRGGGPHVPPVGGEGPLLSPNKNKPSGNRDNNCGKCGELRQPPPNQRQQLLRPLQAPEILRAQFFQTLPCFMRCPKSRSFYGLSLLFQYQQLIFQKRTQLRAQSHIFGPQLAHGPPRCQADIIFRRWVTSMCYRWRH